MFRGKVGCVMQAMTRIEYTAETLSARSGENFLSDIEETAADGSRVCRLSSQNRAPAVDH